MEFAESFERLNITQQSRELANAVYDAMGICSDFDFRNQIQAAAVSVTNNIAEGFERRTKKDSSHFLDQSKGSAGEVRSTLHLAEDRKYIPRATTLDLRTRYSRLPGSIGALASKLRNP